jgi:hypothetical protein
LEYIIVISSTPLPFTSSNVDLTRKTDHHNHHHLSLAKNELYNEFDKLYNSNNINNNKNKRFLSTSLYNFKNIDAIILNNNKVKHQGNRTFYNNLDSNNPNSIYIIDKDISIILHQHQMETTVNNNSNSQSIKNKKLLKLSAHKLEQPKTPPPPLPKRNLNNVISTVDNEPKVEFHYHHYYFNGGLDNYYSNNKQQQQQLHELYLDNMISSFSRAATPFNDSGCVTNCTASPIYSQNKYIKSRPQNYAQLAQSEDETVYEEVDLNLRYNNCQPLANKSNRSTDSGYYKDSIIYPKPQPQLQPQQQQPKYQQQKGGNKSKIKQIIYKSFNKLKIK